MTYVIGIGSSEFDLARIIGFATKVAD